MQMKGHSPPVATGTFLPDKLRGVKWLLRSQFWERVRVKSPPGLEYKPYPWRAVSEPVPQLNAMEIILGICLLGVWLIIVLAIATA